ncbi:hypothetical protein F5Y16DRAFT_396637 [Xylariaceae sp. FL0255]|nr:hypothetical protein F5Y16DRAFT_396637 [Xylariaceae sp. FL0255]
MENSPPTPGPHRSSDEQHPVVVSAGRKRSTSGASLLSRIPFLRTSDSRSSLNNELKAQQQSSSTVASSSAATVPTIAENTNADNPPPRALAAALNQQQQKPRRRKGSLRKVALLGRGAARDKREALLKTQSQLQEPPPLQPHQSLTLDTSKIRLHQNSVPPPISSRTQVSHYDNTDNDMANDGLGIRRLGGLAAEDTTPRPSMEGFGHRTTPTRIVMSPLDLESPSISYTSTTDEEDSLSIPLNVPSPLRADLSSLSSGSDSFYRGSSRAPGIASASSSSLNQRRRSTSKGKKLQQRAKSPLALQGLAAADLGSSEDYDYSETEWWGWVVLIVTWSVFVLGMGSCLNVWSWAWDVGSTPYAPPELEDDPTLPIVGYYPALLILTAIMAWVWVIVAWVGMKYFRHAKISGD